MKPSLSYITWYAIHNSKMTFCSNWATPFSQICSHTYIALNCSHTWTRDSVQRKTYTCRRHTSQSSRSSQVSRRLLMPHPGTSQLLHTQTQPVPVHYHHTATQVLPRWIMDNTIPPPIPVSHIINICTYHVDQLYKTQGNYTPLYHVVTSSVHAHITWFTFDTWPSGRYMYMNQALFSLPPN